MGSQKLGDQLILATGQKVLTKHAKSLFACEGSWRKSPPPEAVHWEDRTAKLLCQTVGHLHVSLSDKLCRPTWNMDPFCDTNGIFKGAIPGASLMTRCQLSALPSLPRAQCHSQETDRWIPKAESLQQLAGAKSIGNEKWNEPEGDFLKGIQSGMVYKGHFFAKETYLAGAKSTGNQKSNDPYKPSPTWLPVKDIPRFIPCLIPYRFRTSTIRSFGKKVPFRSPHPGRPRSFQLPNWRCGYRRLGVPVVALSL